LPGWRSSVCVVWSCLLPLWLRKTLN